MRRAPTLFVPLTVLALGEVGSAEGWETESVDDEHREIEVCRDDDRAPPQVVEPAEAGGHLAQPARRQARGRGLHG